MRSGMFAIALLVVLGVPGQANAQLALPKVTDVEFFVRGEAPLPRGVFTAGLSFPYGFGVEVLFDAGCVTTPAQSCSRSEWRFEYALAMSQVSGFALDGLFDLRARLRIAPEVSLYASRGLVFIGAGVCFADLEGAAYGLDAEAFRLSAETLSPKLSFGLVLFGGAFLEVGYSFRYFPFVDYELTREVTLPDALPRSVFASAVFVNLGYQVKIGSSE